MAVPTALTIAGSDSGGGAGIQADLKTFSALSVYGASAFTAVTAQNTKAVSAVFPLPTDVITAQIEAVLSDIAIDAIKIGMLGTAEIVEAVASSLETFEGPIILDPVMVAKSGDRLLDEDAIDAICERLLARAALVTPNIPEAAVLAGADGEATDEEDMMRQAARILDRGARAVLIKGGHLEGGPLVDLLVTADTSERLVGKRIATRNTHGTGCTYSSAIAALMARGRSLDDAVRAAHEWLATAISEADRLGVGGGAGPVHHFHGLWK